MVQEGDQWCKMIAHHILTLEPQTKSVWLWFVHADWNLQTAIEDDTDETSKMAEAVWKLFKGHRGATWDFWVTIAFTTIDPHYRNFGLSYSGFPSGTH